MAEDPNKITYFAATNSRGTETPFGIKRKDRARHMYVIGKTGMGKSTLLENMAIQDIRNGEGMAFIDPHGSTAERILEYVPEHRLKDVVYFAPFDMEHPIAFNVMEDVGFDKRHLVVSGLLAAFRKIWVDAWSARMEYILSNTLLALLEYEGSTLLDVNRMLINKAFRKKVVDNISDPIVRSFWVEEFANYTDRYTQDATPAIQNKVGQFTSNPLIRNIVGQPKSSFDIRKIMDEKKILIMNLSKGKVGEVNANLLGSMLTTKIYLAAMSRADVPAAVLQSLPSFYFYVDEFQSFANESFADILSEARKYKLNLIIAHQYIEQMEEEVRDAVFGNVGTTISFRVGPFDAEVLETIFQPVFMATDLVNLGFAQVYLTLMIDGVGSPPFSATTLPPFDPPPQLFVERTIANSRVQFGKPRSEVEKTIKDWQESDPVVPEASKPKRQFASPARPATSPRPVPPPPMQPSASPVQPAAVPMQPTAAHSHLQVPFKERADIAKHKIEKIIPQHRVVPAGEPRPDVRADGSFTTQQPRVTPIQKPMSSGHASRSPSGPADGTVGVRVQHVPPPLGGPKSLREALAQATGQKPVVHARDLKATLQTIAPKADASASKPHHIPRTPAELPADELKSMLAVDESWDNENP